MLLGAFEGGGWRESPGLVKEDEVLGQGPQRMPWGLTADMAGKPSQSLAYNLGTLQSPRSSSHPPSLAKW